MKIKYLSLNVWFGGKLWDTMVDFLKREDVDIVALQEVYGGEDPTLEKRLRTIHALKQEVPYPYTAFAPAMTDSKLNLPWGNAILSKFPITKQKAIFFDVPFDEREIKIENAEYAPRNMLHAVIDLGSTTLNVFSLHGIWGKDGEDNPRRLAMSKTILKNIRGKERVILSGDFNVREGTRTIGMLEEELVNVFKHELQTTCNMRQRKNPKLAQAVIDFLFASRDLSAVAHACPDVDVSDHLPLTATFELSLE